MRDGKASGATLVASALPTGESMSSPMVKRNKIQTIAIIGVEFAAPPENGRKKKSDTPMMTLATPNLTGVDHWRLPSLVHRAANTPEKMMSNIGFIDGTSDVRISKTKSSRSRRTSE